MPIGSRLHTIVSDLLAPYDPHQLACEIDGGYVLVIDDQFVVNVFEDVAHDRIRFVGGVAAQHDAAHDEDRQSQAQWIKAEAVDAGVELTVGISETGRLVVLGAAADAATLDAVASRHLLQALVSRMTRWRQSLDCSDESPQAIGATHERAHFYSLV
jgi:hypothetical protein